MARKPTVNAVLNEMLTAGKYRTIVTHEKEGQRTTSTVMDQSEQELRDQLKYLGHKAVGPAIRKITAGEKVKLIFHGASFTISLFTGEWPDHFAEQRVEPPPNPTRRQKAS